VRVARPAARRLAWRPAVGPDAIPECGPDPYETHVAAEEVDHLAQIARLL
jgi:hypothetical protein